MLNVTLVYFSEIKKKITAFLAIKEIIYSLTLNIKNKTPYSEFNSSAQHKDESRENAFLLL